MESTKEKNVTLSVSKIEKDFDILNKLLFENKLILNFPIKIVKSKKFAGCITHNKKTVLCLKISSFYEKSEQSYLNTLAHEMIHVLQVQYKLNMSSGGHGASFWKEVNRINANFSDFNLTETCNSKDFQANENNNRTAKGKVYAVLVSDYIYVSSDDKIDDFDLFRLKNAVSKLFPKEKNEAKIMKIDKSENKRYSFRKSRLAFERIGKECSLVKKIINQGKPLID